MSDAQPAIYYGETPPSHAYARYVVCFWHWRVQPGVPRFIHVIPPDGCVSLWHTPVAGFGLTGPQIQPLRIPAGGGDRVWGVRFRPGVAAALLPYQPEDLRNAQRLTSGVQVEWLEPLHQALRAPSDEEAAARAWERALAVPLAAEPRLDLAVEIAGAELLAAHGDVSIAAISASVGLSPRQLRRRFRAATGLNPKELARICRLRATLLEAVRSGEEQDWAGVAAGAGFADQAHMAREYRRSTGDTPAGLLRYLRRIQHSENLLSGA